MPNPKWTTGEGSRISVTGIDQPQYTLRAGMGVTEFKRRSKYPLEIGIY